MGSPVDGPVSHNVDDEAGHLGHARIPDKFLHKGKARSRRGGHALRSGKRCADNRAHARDFILHLDELSVDAGETDRKDFGDFGGRGNRITRVKGESRGKHAFYHGLISLEEFLLENDAFVFNQYLP